MPICAGPDERWEPATLLRRDHRIRIGLKCKRLIDAGRLEWLLSKGLEVTLPTVLWMV